MAFFLLAGTGLILWYGASQGLVKVQDNENERQQQMITADLMEDEAPHQGPYGHIKDYINVDTRGMFKSVQATRDVMGAEIFLVDYGTGQKVVQYHNPVLLY